MNEHTRELFQSVWESLTAEQLERLRECKTAEDFAAIAAKEGVELPDELMDVVAGGGVVDLKREIAQMSGIRLRADGQKAGAGRLSI